MISIQGKEECQDLRQEIRKAKGKGECVLELGKDGKYLFEAWKKVRKQIVR